jgi:cold shock CspA family protein
MGMKRQAFVSISNYRIHKCEGHPELSNVPIPRRYFSPDAPIALHNGDLLLITYTMMTTSQSPSPWITIEEVLFPYFYGKIRKITDRGCGFIHSGDDTNGDIFFHFSNVDSESTIQIDHPVCFRIAYDARQQFKMEARGIRSLRLAPEDPTLDRFYLPSSAISINNSHYGISDCPINPSDSSGGMKLSYTLAPSIKNLHPVPPHFVPLKKYLSFCKENIPQPPKESSSPSSPIDGEESPSMGDKEEPSSMGEPRCLSKWDESLWEEERKESPSMVTSPSPAFEFGFPFKIVKMDTSINPFIWWPIPICNK